MKIKKYWKPMISIVGIIFMMMTAASVCAEDPLVRETQSPDDIETTDSTDNTDVTTEPLLIMTEDSDETGDLPDYENYTGDMLISPGPEANSDATSPFNLPILGIIGAIIVIVVVMIGIIIKQKKK